MMSPPSNNQEPATENHLKSLAELENLPHFMNFVCAQAQFAGYCVAKETGIYEEHGLNYLEDGIYVLKETWRQKPDLCRAFVKASLKGWKQAFTKPELALEITVRNLKKEHIISNRAHQE